MESSSLPRRGIYSVAKSMQQSVCGLVVSITGIAAVTETMGSLGSRECGLGCAGSVLEKLERPLERPAR